MFKITAGVEGMTCPKCEERVSNAVKKNFRVKKVESSRVDKSCQIVASKEIPEDKLRSVVQEAGYTLVSYKSEPIEKKGLFGG